MSRNDLSLADLVSGEWDLVSTHQDHWARRLVAWAWGHWFTWVFLLAIALMVAYAYQKLKVELKPQVKVVVEVQRVYVVDGHVKGVRRGREGPVVGHGDFTQRVPRVDQPAS